MVLHSPKETCMSTLEDSVNQRSDCKNTGTNCAIYCTTHTIQIAELEVSKSCFDLAPRLKIFYTVYSTPEVLLTDLSFLSIKKLATPPV